MAVIPELRTTAVRKVPKEAAHGKFKMERKTDCYQEPKMFA